MADHEDSCDLPEVDQMPGTFAFAVRELREAMEAFLREWKKGL